MGVVELSSLDLGLLAAVVAHLTKVPAYLYLGFSFVDNAYLIAVLTLAAVAGAGLGVGVLHRVSTGLFFRLMKAALFIAAGRICYQLFFAGA